MPVLNNSPADLADTLIPIIKKHGIIIHRYDAATTNSVYLKFDYGVANSLRISDHRGKDHLKYRYNLEIGCQNHHVVDKFDRYFFNEISLIQLLNQIIADRNNKIKKYGKTNYKTYMSQQKEHAKNQQNFWRHAVKV